MKSLRPLAVALFIAVILAGILSNATPASAQVRTPPATNIQVVNGHNPGEVIISWNAVPEAMHYRIGYVNLKTDYPIAKASRTGNWREAFIYVDVETQNYSRTVYTIRRLEQGARHAFAVLTNNSRYGQPTWPNNPAWQYLTVTDQGGACPTATAPAPAPLSNVELVRLIKPALVRIIATPSDGKTYSGTGFIVQPNGLVVTNRHVVDDASTVTLLMNTLDGQVREFTGQVLGRGILADLAVIQLDSSRTFATLPLGDSDAVTFGTEITAWGYPFGSSLGPEPAVTLGIISSLNRTFEDTNYFQTDAALNQGNSGGPLVDRYGRIIGVNTAGLVNAEGQPIHGIYLAITSNEVSNRLNTMASGGPALATYRNLRFAYGYSMDIPKGWYPNSERQSFTQFLPFTGRRIAYIERYPFIEPSGDKSAELSLLADYYWNTALPEFAGENWDYFRKISKEQVNVAGQEFYRLEFQARWQPGLCILNYIEMVSVSSSYPGKPIGFVTGNGICEDSLAMYDAERQAMLNSFRP